MDEEFALVITDNDAGADPGERPAPQEAEEILSRLRGLADDSQVELTVGSAGYGADWITVTAAVTGAATLLVTLFAQGTTLRDNIAAWRDIGVELRAAIARLKDKYLDVSLSEPAARVLAVSMLLERDIGLDGLELLSHTTVPLPNSGLTRDQLANFRYQPDRFYVYVFRDMIQDAYVVTLRSTGQVESIQRLPAGDWCEYHGCLFGDS